MKKEDNNKDVKAKATDNKAKSDKQQKELPKTGESDSTWLRNGLVILSAFIVLGIYRLSRKYEV
ncbi:MULTISPECIES: LPXTG cell wall anchor domain-containing protein [unclassified Mammaliicoccus]|uniref:LPXTG cell wall anchor domain-containing protein n=1 Tax=unclassified Mammaliicoccus TaxID=2803851 RepID=UPI001EFB03DB|nr:MULTISPECIES: LPXTG cell wall anchor domain-containing protein [unclassified Mammaliicoccus]